MRTSIFAIALIGCGHAAAPASEPTTAEHRTQVPAVPQMESLTLPVALCTYRVESGASFAVGFDADAFVPSDEWGYEGFAIVQVPDAAHGTVEMIVPDQPTIDALWIRGESPAVSFVGAIPREESKYTLSLRQATLFGGVIAEDAGRSATILAITEGELVVKAPELNAFAPSAPMDARMGCDTLTANQPQEQRVVPALATPLAHRGVAFAQDGAIPVRAVQGGSVVGTLTISAETDHEAELLEEGTSQVRIAFYDQNCTMLLAWVPKSSVRLLQRNPRVTRWPPPGGGGGVRLRRSSPQSVTCGHALPLIARVGTTTRQVGVIHSNTQTFVYGETTDHLMQIAFPDPALIATQSRDHELLTLPCNTPSPASPVPTQSRAEVPPTVSD